MEKRALYGAFFLVLGILCWSYGSEILLKMNKAKFPPKLLYIFWSSFSIITLFVFYNRLKISKPNFITNIGTNAIFYYFAQGISSSLVYFIVVPLEEKMSWWILMAIIYILNVALAIIIANLLQKMDGLGWNFLELLRKKTAS